MNLAVSHSSKDRARPWSIWRLGAFTLVLGAIAVAGCGGSKGSTTASPPATASVSSTPTNTSSNSESSSSSSLSGSASGPLSLSSNSEGQLAYSTKSLSAKAGKVSIAFTNNAPLSHNVTVESSSGSVLGSTPTFQGGSKTLTLNLKPGTYKFFCSVPGHRMAGMEGTLVVK